MSAAHRRADFPPSHRFQSVIISRLVLEATSQIVPALSFGSHFLNRALADEPPHRGFEDIAAKSGVRFRHASSKTAEKYLPESMGSGVAMLDYDNNGLLDLFFVNGAALQSPMPAGVQPDKSDPRYWNRLFRNNGDNMFTDVTEAAGLKGAGYGMGVSAADYNNDGFPDIYVTSLGRNTLYRNNGNSTFTDVPQQAGVGASGWSVSACFVDYDRDGRLDLIVSRYLDWDFSKNIYCGEQKPGYRAYCHPDQFQSTTHWSITTMVMAPSPMFQRRAASVQCSPNGWELQ